MEWKRSDRIMFWLGCIVGGTIGMFLACIILGSVLKDDGDE